jgi:type IV pilus assembly protein PilZ
VEKEQSKAMSIAFDTAIKLKKHFMPHVKGGGIFVETESNINMGSEILLMMTLPDGGARSPVVGKVVWVMPKDNREGRPAGIGVQIVNDRSGVLNRINSILSDVPSRRDVILTF